MPPIGMPRSRAFDSPAAPACAGVSAAAVSVTAASDVGVVQFAGTDSIPTLPAWPALANTAPSPPPPLTAFTPNAPPRCRPANCGVGNQAPPAPAVVPPGPDVSCWPIDQPKFPLPTPKYACRVCLRIGVAQFAGTSTENGLVPFGIAPRNCWIPFWIVDSDGGVANCCSNCGIVAAEVSCELVAAAGCPKLPAGWATASATETAWSKSPCGVVVFGGDWYGANAVAAADAAA